MIFREAVRAFAIFASFLISTGRAEAADNGFPNNAGFFPIGVWMQSPTRALQYKALGINTFVGLWKGPTELQLSQLSQADMFAVAEQNDIGLTSANRHIVKAWMHPDEPDNAQPLRFGGYGTCIPAADVVAHTERLKARDPTRPVLINFGQGVANEAWKGRGPCSGDRQYYEIASQKADILSFDIYPVGSTTPSVKGKLEYVARGVSKLLAIADARQKVWAVLETTALNPVSRVTPAQIRTELWMALIHGASGIVYFVHEFKPAFHEAGIFKYPDVISEVSRNNHLIKSLAPVLNSPNSSLKVDIRSDVPIAVMVKQLEDADYIFCVAMRDVESRPSFAIDGVADSHVEVLNENRTIDIRQGIFNDNFDGYGVRLYRIPRIKY